jgi:hypothetical protein
MESIVRAALAAGGPMGFHRMPPEGADGTAAFAEVELSEPPLSPSPAVRFASPVAISLAEKDELQQPLSAATAAGEDLEAPVPPPTGRGDFMAMTVSSLLGQRLGAGTSQNADLMAMALIGVSAFIYSL